MSLSSVWRHRRGAVNPVRALWQSAARLATLGGRGGANKCGFTVPTRQFCVLHEGTLIARGVFRAVGSALRGLVHKLRVFHDGV